MLKKYFTFLITVLVINLSFATTAFAETKEEKAAFAEKVKLNVAKLGTGTDAKVQVKLKDGTKLKGHVSQINENSFSVTNEKTGAVTEVPYPNAKQVKGKNLSNGVLIAIGVGIVVTAIIILGSLAAKKD